MLISTFIVNEFSQMSLTQCSIVMIY